MKPVERFKASIMAIDEIDPKGRVCNFGMDSIFTRKLLRGATLSTGSYCAAIVVLTGNPPESQAWRLAAQYVASNILPLVAAAKWDGVAVKPATYRQWTRDLRATLGDQLCSVIDASRHE